MVLKLLHLNALGVFNFRRSDGALMFCDFKSAQGSFINKSKCEENTFYRLFVGDMIRFGASTRRYIVCGPEEHRPPEYASANMELYRQSLALKSSRAKEEKEKEEKSSFASWGFDEDAPAEKEGDDEDGDEADDDKKSKIPNYLLRDEHYHRKYGEKFSVDIDDIQVSENDKKVIEKIRKKERKIQNMQEENRRIFMKESNQDGGLTEGQQTAVDRNDKAIESLSNEIENLVNTLQGKAAQRQRGKTAGKAEAGEGADGELSKKKNARRLDDDDDEVLDLTDHAADISTNWRLKKKLAKTTQSASGIIGSLLPLHAFQSSSSSSTSSSRSVGVTYKEIKTELDKQRSLLVAVKAQVSQHEETVSSSATAKIAAATDEGRGGSGGNDDDDLDLVISEDRSRDALANLSRLKVEEADLARKVRQLEQLLHLATPALQSLATATATAGVPLPPIPTPSQRSQLECPSPSHSAVQAKAAVAAAAAVEGTDRASTTSVHPEDKASSQENEASSSVFPFLENVHPGKFEQLNQLKVEPEASGSTVQLSSVLKKNDNDGKDPSKQVKAPKRVIGAVRKPPVVVNKVEPIAPAYGGSMLEGGDAIWTPPSAQTGDGKTSLNAKYGY